MERLFLNNDIKNVVMRMIYECGESKYFECAITYDGNVYHIWVNSSLYNQFYEIENKTISESSAKLIFDMLFPIQRWGIKESGPLMVDGPYLDIIYNRDSEIKISGSKFNYRRVEAMIELIIDECKL